MAGKTAKSKAREAAVAFRSDEALLEAAQEAFAARRAAEEAAQRGESTPAAVQARRAEAARRTRQWHHALRANLKHSILAQRLKRGRLSGTEREALVALVLSQLGLLSSEIRTCGDLMALFRHSCRATLSVLRSLAEDGRLVRSGLVVVDDDEGDVPHREISIAPNLIEGLVLRGGRRATWCDVATEEKLYERLDKLTRAFAAKREFLGRDSMSYYGVARARRAVHKVEGLLEDLTVLLRHHPGWRLARIAKEWQFCEQWVVVVALLGKRLGHLPPDDRLFTGGGLACAPATTYDNSRAILQLFGPDRPLLQNEVIRPCGGQTELASGQPEGLEHVEFELTEATIRRLGLEGRARTTHYGEFQAREPRLRMEQLVFSLPVQEALAMAVAHARHARRLFDDWGLGATVAYGRNPALLFSGPPGVGKTAAAEALACELDKPLLVADYSRIQNCFVGQTEKNIVRAFREAHNQDAVLFWDEADAMFYSRDAGQWSWEIRDVNLLLQELERFEGVCILATNRAAALDPALERRIAIKVLFERPDQTQRRRIWEKLLPQRMPLAPDVDLNTLSQLDLSGGEIKNVILNAARLALQRNREGPVSMADFRKAIDLEQSGQWSGTVGRRIGFSN